MEIYEAMRSKKGKQNLEEDSEEENDGLPEPMEEDNGAGKITDDQRQKSSRLRCLLCVKSLVICFYLGWSGSILQFRQNIIKVGSKSRLLSCLY